MRFLAKILLRSRGRRGRGKTLNEISCFLLLRYTTTTATINIILDCSLLKERKRERNKVGLNGAEDHLKKTFPGSIEKSCRQREGGS